MRALLCAMSVMTTFEVDIGRALGVPPQGTIPSAIRLAIAVVIIGRVWLLNNFCGGFPLVVSVTFLFFTSLV